MIRLKSTFRKVLATVLVGAVLSTLSAPVAYADNLPGGPASDTSIVAQNRNGAKGPGAAEIQQPAQPEQAEQQQSAQQQAEQPQQAQPEQPLPQIPIGQEPENAQQPAAEPEAADGKVMSGGRWIDPSKPMIALTFDDGPYAPVGNRIMDTLEKHNGRATFFVVGNRVPNYKTEINRMQQNGHEIANHTYDHKYLNKLGAAEIRRQIEKCNEIVASVTGVPPKLVRLPGGLKNSTVLANVHYPMLMWNIDTLDWKTRNAQKTVDAVLGKVQDGDIVLMHELYLSTADAIDTIVPALTEQGYQLVTVSEMASFRGGMSAGGIYNKFRP